LKFIGRVADGSTETSARVILLKGLEKEVAAESLVIVDNGGNPSARLLGVLRGGLGKNEFLSPTAYRPDVAYMRHGGEPSAAREVYSFTIKPIGLIGEKGLEPNLFIIQPRSPVYLLEDEDNPFSFMVKEADVVWMDAYVEGHESWRVPVLKEFLSYHVGVYGSTGSGKSWFTRYVLVPLYLKADFRVLILDWSGTDYAPHYASSSNAEVVEISKIALDEEAVLSYLNDKTSNFGGSSNVRDSFEIFVESWTEWVQKALNAAEAGEEPANLLHRQLKESVFESVRKIKRPDYQEAAERAARRAFRKLKPRDLRPIMGTLTIEDLMGRLKEKKVLIVDMGGTLAEAKLSFFLSLSNHLYDLMESGEDLNLSLIIDEAPQYAPWDARGIQNNTTEMIKNLAALGRKRKLNLTLISQGIRGEIGINASVRRNINTHFFGRIHPLDAGGEGGASEWLSPYDIKPDQLLQLKPGRFYFSGAMNPSPVPLLITYKPPEGAR